MCGDPLTVYDSEPLVTGDYYAVILGRELEQDLVLGPLFEFVFGTEDIVAD
jgi:hypothetical protein